ncbi:MAG: ATP-binding protein, partial [Candidatus Omnitrophica bacterium]|nr:ATP-binding protein [Candidatus Omnitrophota bacterium]
ERKNLGITFTARENIRIIGDEKELKQLFLNILDNAVKYTPEGGKITMSVERSDEHARIVINDTGVGIPSNDIVHIFDRFYRVRSVKSSYGFGLGLSISKAIVDSHNGSIKVESAPGEGTTFIITLPLQ